MERFFLLLPSLTILNQLFFIKASTPTFVLMLFGSITVQCGYCLYLSGIDCGYWGKKEDKKVDH